MQAQIRAGFKQVLTIDTLAAYVHISLHDSNNNLVSFIESERTVLSNLTAFNYYLDDIKDGKSINDPTIHNASYSFTKKNVTRNEQDLEMVTVRYQGVYNGVNLAVSKTSLSPSDTWRLIADTDGYPMHKGDHFDFLWTILRPIS